jgi:hypothetical protein
MDLLNGKGYAEATYIWRSTGNFIEDYISLANGVTKVVKNGFDVGTFTNKVYRNTDDDFRKYQGVEFQGRYTITPRWSVYGNETVQLKNHGNYEGEAANQPGITSRLGDYPEIFNAARHYPDGRLSSFQRSKARLWTIYNADLGRFGTASFSGVLRADSGATYSLRAAGQRLTAVQNALISTYPDAPSSQTVYFGERGSQSFKGYGVLDFSTGYNIPVFKTLRPWIKLDVYNLMNNQKQIAWNTAVSQDGTSPKDSLGLATGYKPGGSYGKATSNAQFPLPYAGQTGGRTYRVAGGIRF